MGLWKKGWARAMGQKEQSARTRKAAAVIQTPSSTTSVLGDVPLGVSCFRDRLSGDAAARDAGA